MKSAALKICHTNVRASLLGFLLASLTLGCNDESAENLPDGSLPGADGAVIVDSSSNGGSDTIAAVAHAMDAAIVDAPTTAIGACPMPGYYDVATTGTGCGDLSTNAKQQRLDSAGCRGNFEFDGGAGKGVGSATITFATDGTLARSAFQIGSATLDCTATASASTVSLSCASDAGICSIRMTWTAKL